MYRLVSVNDVRFCSTTHLILSTPLNRCETTLEGFQVRWLRKLVEREYRVHMTFDQLPVLMRSQELNYAVKGIPVGFKTSMEYAGDGKPHLYLYNPVSYTHLTLPTIYSV